MTGVLYSVKMYFRRGLANFFYTLRDLRVILSWWETWVPTFVALGIVGFWSFYAFALTLPNPWRSLIIWGSAFGLVMLAPGYLFLSGRKR